MPLTLALRLTASAEGIHDGEMRWEFQTPDAIGDSRFTIPTNAIVHYRAAGRMSAGCLSIGNPTPTTHSFAIRCGDFCHAGEGVMITMWVRAEAPSPGGIRSQLGLVREGSAGVPRNSLPLSSVPLMDTKWTLLSGWSFRGSRSGTPLEFNVTVAPKSTLLIDDIVLTRSSMPQPRDERKALIVKGADIMEGDKKVVLHGMNLYACSDDENDDTRHATSAVTEDDYRDIAAAGFNCVRLNLWHKVFRDDGGWEWLKLHCLWARRQGLRIILDMHSPPGGYQSRGYRGGFWTSPQMRDALIRFWVKAAGTFKDDPVIAAFDLLNEPKPPSEKEWLIFAANTLKAIRQAGWDRPVLIESSMTQDVDGWSAMSEKFDDAGVIYDTHFYTPWSFTYAGKAPYGKPCADYGHRVLDAAFLKDQLENDLLAFARKFHVPVNIGEFGVSEKALSALGDRWLSDVLGVMNQQAINRQYFCWVIYGDFAIEPGWFRLSPPARRDRVLATLKDAQPRPTGQSVPAGRIPRGATED